VTFGEIMLSDLGASMEILVNDGNLTWGWTVGSNMPITLTVVTLNYRTKHEKVTFGVLALSVTFSTFIIGVLLLCWSLCMNLF